MIDEVARGSAEGVAAEARPDVDGLLYRAARAAFLAGG